MVIRAACFIMVFLLLFGLTTEILKDKRIEGEYNPTTKVRGFYAEEKNTLDFVFVGSSQVYADISPAVLYRDFGMTSYDFCANEQPMWISYYYIKEALKRQNPKAIILDVFTMYGADYEEEGVNHINLDDLPLSLNKIKAIRDSVPKELRSSFYFEIAKYHTTWEGLDEAKFNATFKRGKDPMKGYSPFVNEADYENGAKAEVVNQTECEELPERAKEWLLKIIELTKKENVPLVLIKTPNGNAERQKLYNSVAKLAEEEKIPFVNMNTVFDGEAHINVMQAEKVTQYIGQYLSDNYEFADKRGMEGCEDWEKSVALFEACKEQCSLISKTTLPEYMEELSALENKVIMVAANQTEHIPEETLKLFKELGVEWTTDEAGKKYVAILSEKTVIKEHQGTGKQNISENIGGHSFRVKMNEDGDGKEKITFKVDGMDYAVPGAAFSVLVYDTVLEKAVDVVGADPENMEVIVR